MKNLSLIAVLKNARKPPVYGAFMGLLFAFGAIVYGIPFAFWKANAAPPPSFTISGVTGGTDSTQDAWLSNDVNPTIHFASLAGATGYDVVIKDSAGVVTLCSLLNQASSPVSPSSCGLTNGGTYKIYLTAKPSNTPAFNDAYSFTVDNTAPTANSITGITGASDAVVDTWLTGGLTPTLNWNAFTNAGSYDVTIKDSAGTTTICATQNTATTFFDFASCTLADGTAYRAYVTAKSPAGFQTTNASNTGLSFTVDNTSPGNFNVTGITGGTDVLADAYLADGTDPTVVYGASTNVYRYDIIIKNSSGTTTVCSLLDQTGSPSTITCGLSNGLTYKAYVTAKSISGYLTTAASNDGYSFVVTSSPASSPANFLITGATGGSDVTADNWLTSGTTVTANWNSAAGAQNYSVTIRNSTDTADVCATQVTASTSYTFTGCTLSDATVYLIKVTANNAPAASTAALNNSYAFQVVTPMPGPFSVTGATGGTDTSADAYLMSGTTVTANWSASSGASSYDVTVRNSGDTADVCATQNTASTSYTFTGCTLTANTTYTIKVVAKSGSQTTAAYNNPFSFYLPAAATTFCPTGSSTAKALVIYDSGGSGGNYSTSESCNFTISPPATASSIILNFTSFSSNDATDILKVYDAASATNILGTFKNTSSAPADQIAVSGNMYLTWSTGASGVAAGYNMNYRAIYSPPGSFTITGVQGGSDVTANATLTDNSSGVTAVWNTSSGATSYSVTIRNSTNTNDICSTATTASTSYNFASCTLMQGASYAVTVLSKDANGNWTSAANSPYVFTYDARPTSFSITGITGGSDSTADSYLESGTTATVNWGASTSQTSYDVTIFENDGFTVKCPKVNVSSGSTSYTFASCSLTLQTSYKVEVLAKNANGSTPAVNNYFGFSVGTSWTPTSLTSAPTSRYQHSAVWTGSEMIVWGGYNGSYHNTGGRYNPTTDAWTATSTGTDVPAARYNHTAVWTGSEMIVWGGEVDTVYLSSGGRYNPSSNTWSKGNLFLLSERTNHSAVWTGSEMIVWGGYNGSYHNTGGRYNPTTDAWTATSTGANVPSVRRYHTAIWTGTEMIIWGGSGSGGGYNTGGKYNPTTDSWVATSTGTNIPSGRSGHTAVWTGTEMIIWGGGYNTGGKYNPTTDSWVATSTINAPVSRDNSTAVWTGTEMLVWGGNNASNGYYFNTGGKYNPSTDSWTACVLSLFTERLYYSAVWTGSEMIIWGGTSGTSASVLNIGNKYNPSTDSWTATGTGANVPSARQYHSAIWTGTEMIVWGGIDTSSTYLNTGGKYNPSSNSWTATSAGANVPSARQYHSAIWTGTEMIVWGGYNGSSLNSGGKYNPSGDSWTTTSMGANVPSARRYHTAVWTGTEMIIWGGYNFAYYNSGGRYNPTTDSWTPTTSANVPAARYRHTAVWTGAEMLVWGGETAGRAYNTGGKYTPSTDSWADSSSLSLVSERSSHSAIWTGTEMIIWGGYNGDYLNTGRKYNPSTDSWTVISTGANLPLARYGHTAIWTSTDMIVWGGYNSTYLNTGGKYNPSTNSWTTMSTGSNVPSARNYHTAIWTGTEMIIWGGEDNSYTYLNSGGKYNPSSNSWTTTSTGTNVPVARRNHTAVWTGAEMIVWGGSNGSALNSGGKYNPSGDSWTATSTGTNVPVGRSGHTAIWTGSEMIVWGGSNGGALNSGGKYNPSGDSWTATSTGTNVPAGRSGHTAIWTGSEMIVWGAYYPGSVNTGGKYNPSTDSWTATSIGTDVPLARSNHTAVWTGTEMIIWGGSQSNAWFNTGGKYNPSTDSWTSTSTGTNVPTERSNHTAVWTGTEMIVWGGSSGSTFYNSGGKYNLSGDSWTATSTGANVPSTRASHTAIWTGTEMVIWGGYNGNYLNTGGKYNPSTNSWTATSTGTNVPVGRYLHTAVWTGSDMIVWGGFNGGALNSGGKYNPSGDSWTATSTGTNVPTAGSGATAVWTGSEMIVWGTGFSTGGKYNPTTDSWIATSTTNAPVSRSNHTAVWTGSVMIVWGGKRNTYGYLNTGGKYNPSSDSWVDVSSGNNVPSGRTNSTAIWTGTEMIVWGGG